jgi:DNA polymerase
MKTADSKQIALDNIAQQIERCKMCKQNKIGKAVPGEGSSDADVVFIGEAPGKNEANTGRPFIGRAGKLLRTLIAEAGLKDDDVFITSPVKRLPVYVTPTEEDIAHGRKHLNKQLDIIKPKIVVLLGRVAALALLNKNISVAKEHGTIIEQDGRKYLIAYHPAAPLYSPKLRDEIMKDFKKLKKLIAKK